MHYFKIVPRPFSNLGTIFFESRKCQCTRSKPKWCRLADNWISFCADVPFLGLEPWYLFILPPSIYPMELSWFNPSPYSLLDLKIRLSLWRFRNRRVKGKKMHCGLLRMTLLEHKRKSSCCEEVPVLSPPPPYLEKGGGIAKGCQRSFPKTFLKSWAWIFFK